MQYVLSILSTGVRADSSLHAALGSQCCHGSAGTPAADVEDPAAGAVAHAHHRRQHPTRDRVPTGRGEPCSLWQHPGAHWYREQKSVPVL